MSTGMSTQPIGIFDSGIGGLTVARALVELLPKENIIYFGDTAHLPYGDKSTAAIQAYSVKIAHMLLKQQCKLILIACNSASAAAYELVKEYIASKAHVINVIDPMVYHLRENFVGKNIGLIGTKQTINSNIYKKKVDSLNVGITLKSQATPLLAPLIEEGFVQEKFVDDLLEEYLSNESLTDIDALVLGCTHYPVIKDTISKFYGDKVSIIDSSEIVAKSVKAHLEYENLLNKEGPGTRRFYVSDYTESFAAATKLFFNEEVNLECYPLWE